MNFKKQIARFVIIYLFLIAGSSYSSYILGNGEYVYSSGRFNSFVYKFKSLINKSSEEVAQMNESLKISLSAVVSGGDFTQSRHLVEKIIQRTNSVSINDSVLSESYYLIGIYYLLARNFNESIRYLELCISSKVKRGEFDERYARALYNLSLAYLNLGDFKKHEEYSSKALEAEKKINGESNPVMANIYLSLGLAYVELQEYEKALNYLNLALTISSNKPESVSPQITADLYENMGVCYSRMADFSKARIFLDKAESLYKQFNLKLSDNYINLMNSSAITYEALRLPSEAEEYYEKVIPIAVANNSPIAYNIINSYAIFLANNGNLNKGEELLINALERAKTRSEFFPRNYIEVLINYANYLRDYNIDNKKSVKCFKKCLEYIQMNDQDLSLKTSVYLGYSLSLDEEGEPEKALGTIQILLVSDLQYLKNKGNYINPDIDSLKPDRLSLKILNTKYRILWDIYRKTNDQQTLEAASNTSELIVSLIEKVRINISEDNSRLILGNRYRDAYINAIRDFNLLYIKTNNARFLGKIFEFTEKSKVATLLASARELKATQLNIAAGIGDYEKKLRADISLYNARLAEETAKELPNYMLINKWKENLLEATRSRDSLVLIFEKQYPVYYAIKYNTKVSELKDIPKILGRNGNYINYILSDTVLYTFVANKRYQRLITTRIDSSFFSDIRKFRSALSMPLPSDNASLKFYEFRDVGFRLYKTLIDPVRSFLISSKVYISPDNILSYLPFETLPTSLDSKKNILYSDLNYLMNSYDISYTYSATFMAESVKKDYGKNNKLIAFAPDYREPIDIQSVLKSRQAGSGVLNDLPFARQEAKYVSDITGGTLFANSDAKESVFKKESGNYDIIHLAMHTLLNDKDPMNSTLIFSQGNDSPEDGLLKTYEVYGIPLRAKMVVLSSCNTGTGILSSGEGILSLARGFMYSGSESVVMSMWEIEDKSGTEIVESFYNNLKKGYSKSIALRKARKAFIEKADQLRSHPYFWASLVVYGNNTPLYYSMKLRVAIIAIPFILFFLSGFYFWKRKYS